MKVRVPFAFEQVEWWTGTMAWAMRPFCGHKYGPRLRGQHRTQAEGTSFRRWLRPEDRRRQANANRRARREALESTGLKCYRVNGSEVWE